MTEDVLRVLCRAETGIFDVPSVSKGSVGRNFPSNGTWGSSLQEREQLCSENGCKWSNTSDVNDKSVRINWESWYLTHPGRTEHCGQSNLKVKVFSGLDTCCCFSGVLLPLLISPVGTSSSTGLTGSSSTSKYYDDIYFDSDSEDEDKKGKWQRQEEGIFIVPLTLSDPVKSSWGNLEAVSEGSVFEGNYQPVSSQCSSCNFMMYPNVMLWGHALGGEMSQVFKFQFKFIAKMENENSKLYILIICVWWM